MENTVLTNRELVALILLVIISAFALTRPERDKLLSSARGVLRSLAAPSILVPLVLYGGWISAAAASGACLGLWNFDLLKTTILWLMLSGFALVLRLNDAIEKPGFFRRALFKTLGVAAVVEFLAALKSFPLWLELPAQALAFLLAGIAVVAERKPEQAPLRKVANGYLIIFGLSAVIWSAAHVVANWSGLDQGRIVREFLLPIWLTPAALVFVYGFAVVAAYQAFFRRMRTWNKNGGLLRQRLAVVARANGRLGRLRLLTGLGIQRIAQAESFRDSWREFGVLKDEHRQRISDEAEAKQRLIDFSGVMGTDELGRQLDRREFLETQSALKFLAMCHTGHYRSRDQRYRADLLPIVEFHFARDGLPEDHGVEMKVSRDGQSWCATRQAVTGWWFGIGAVGPPPDEWLYDGPTRPTAFPTEPDWDRFGGGAASVNWE